jgi:hypothetical protein
MSQSFIIKPGEHYIEEVKKKCYLEVVIYDDHVDIIERGGPLEPTVLSISGKNLDIHDWWGWGQG